MILMNRLILEEIGQAPLYAIICRIRVWLSRQRLQIASVIGMYNAAVAPRDLQHMTQPLKMPQPAGPWASRVLFARVWEIPIRRILWTYKLEKSLEPNKSDWSETHTPMSYSIIPELFCPWMTTQSP